MAGGHLSGESNVPTYASVVSRESVRIALTLAALNDLEVKAADIQNAYLTAPNAERSWTTLGDEFGTDAGKTAIIVRALYGQKTAGAAFRNHLADCFRHMGYQSCLADPDVWIRPETRPDDGEPYYSYILGYVDDLLVIHHNAMSVLRQVNHYFQCKPDSMGDPDIYLGGKLRTVTLDNGVHAWALSSSKYVQEAVRNAKEYFRRYYSEDAWPKRAPTRIGLSWISPRNSMQSKQTIFNLKSAY